MINLKISTQRYRADFSFHPPPTTTTHPPKMNYFKNKKHPQGGESCVFVNFGVSSITCVGYVLSCLFAIFGVLTCWYVRNGEGEWGCGNGWRHVRVWEGGGGVGMGGEWVKGKWWGSGGGGIVCFTDFGMYVLSCVFVNFGVTTITYGYVLECLFVKFCRDDMYLYTCVDV